MGLGITVALLPLYLFAAPLLQLLFPAFPDAVAPFRLLFWSAIVVLLVYPLYLGFYAADRPGKVSVAYAVLAAASICGGLRLIPAYGVMGAAWTTLTARLLGAATILAFLLAERRRRGAGMSSNA
jgi:O-antigen/teichoic acid export membrane protein